jgi:hypothetical protein
MIVSQLLGRLPRGLRRCNFDKCLDRGPCDSECNCSKASIDPRRRRDTVARFSQDKRIAEARPKLERHKDILDYHVVTAGSPQTTYRPCIDDVTFLGRDKQEPGLWRTSRGETRFGALIDDTVKIHPGSEFATAYK